MSVFIPIAIWIGVAVIAIGVARVLMGDEFEPEEHIPPCVLWPVCVAILIPVGVGWVLFYWIPVKSADSIRKLRLGRGKQPTAIEQPKPSDWR